MTFGKTLTEQSMKEERKMNAAEIAELHGVSERTAYRWLADDDCRVYATVTDKLATATKAVPMSFSDEFILRARTFERAMAGFFCFLAHHADRGHPSAIEWHKLFRKAINSDAIHEFYDATGMNDTDDDEE